MKRIICLLLTSVLLLLSVGCTSNIEIPSATNQTVATVENNNEIVCDGASEYQSFLESDVCPEKFPTWDVIVPFLEENTYVKFFYNSENDAYLAEGLDRKYTASFNVRKNRNESDSEPIAYQGVLGNSIRDTGPSYDELCRLFYFPKDISLQEYMSTFYYENMQYIPMNSEDIPDVFPTSFSELCNYWFYSSASEVEYEQRVGNYYQITEHVILYYWSNPNVANPGRGEHPIIFFDMEGYVFGLSFFDDSNPTVKKLLTKSTAKETADELYAIFESSVR